MNDKTLEIVEKEIEEIDGRLQCYKPGSDEYQDLMKHMDILLTQYNELIKNNNDAVVAEANIENDKQQRKNEKFGIIVENSVNGVSTLIKLGLTATLIAAMVVIEKEGTCRSKVWNSITKLF